MSGDSTIAQQDAGRRGQWELVKPVVGEYDDEEKRVDERGHIGEFRAGFVEPKEGHATVRGDGYLHLASPHIASKAGMGSDFDACVADSWRRWAAWSSHYYLLPTHEWRTWVRGKGSQERLFERFERMAKRYVDRRIGRLAIVASLDGIAGDDAVYAAKAVTEAVAAIAMRAEELKAIPEGWVLCSTPLVLHPELNYPFPQRPSCSGALDPSKLVVGPELTDWILGLVQRFGE